MTLKVGLIGCGGIAWVHAPAIRDQKQAELVAVCDLDTTRAHVLANAFGVDKVFPDAAQMIAETELDVVHVAVAPHLHADLAILAMERGCHVLVEKPLATSSEEAKRMLDVASRNDVQLCVNHNLVYDSAVKRVLEYVDAGLVGEVVTVDSHFSYRASRNPALIAEGVEHAHWSYELPGGPLQDLLPHPASLLLEFLDSVTDVQSVSRSRGVLPAGFPDELQVALRSVEATGSISVSLGARPDTITLTVHGTDGTVHADLFSGLVVVQRRSVLPRFISRGLSGLSLSWQHFRGTLANVLRVLSGRFDKSGGMRPLFEAYYRQINEGGGPAIPVEKSLAVVELMERLWREPVVSRNERSRPTSPIRNDAPLALVTGASGFIGSHLVKNLLEDGVRVRALVRPNSVNTGRLRAFDVEVVEGDLYDRATVVAAAEGADTIYHAGASTGDSWDEQERATIEGTRNVIEACRRHGSRRLVHLSTLAVYELLTLPRGDRVIREDSPYQKRAREMGPYAWAKIEAEKLLFEAHDRDGLPMSIVRPGIVIGPKGRPFFPHLGFRFQDSLFVIVGRGEHVLPLTHVDNTVAGIRAVAIADGALGQAFNLVDDGDVSVREYLDAFVKRAELPARVVRVPTFLPYCAVVTYEILSGLGFMPKGKTSRVQFRSKRVQVRFDNTKAKECLDWKPTVSVDHAIDSVADWYRAERVRFL